MDGLKQVTRAEIVKRRQAAESHSKIVNSKPRKMPSDAITVSSKLL
jgi:hypothetical protein